MAHTQLTVREARASDVADIANFFRHVRRRFVTFGEEDLPYLLREGHVFVAQTGHLLWGVLVLSSLTNGWARLRGLGLIDGWQALAGVRLLWSAAAPALADRNVSTVDCVLTEAWLHGPLEGAGFRVVDRVVTLLRHTHSMPDVPEGPARVRLLRPDEVAVVERVDADAFPPQWHYTRRDLTHMLATGCRITVATIEEEVVGYVAVEQHGEFGHVIRLAVHPLWQDQGIGRQLLLDAMHFLREAGATRLSLNTQQSNVKALKFYERLQFRRFGRVIPVLEKPLART